MASLKLVEDIDNSDGVKVVKLQQPRMFVRTGDYVHRFIEMEENGDIPLMWLDMKSHGEGWKCVMVEPVIDPATGRISIRLTGLREDFRGTNLPVPRGEVR